MRTVALAGGVGGAKLVHGLALALNSENLTVVVNTGDDFFHYGLKICPDLDTVCYTLAGLANPETGWGRKKDTWNVWHSLSKIGGPIWFRLGDKDLATHLERTRRLNEGQSLTQITHDLCVAWEVRVRVLPMSNHPAPTIVLTDEGDLSFQEYFVQKECQPKVTGFRFEGIQKIPAAPGVLEAIDNADLVVFCPSNPWVSLDPILSVPKIKDYLESKIVIGVSPIIGGDVIKGPAAKMYRELGIKPTAFAVANHYVDWLRGFVFDNKDANLFQKIEDLGVKSYMTDTIMHDISDRLRLAEEVLEFGGKCSRLG